MGASMGKTKQTDNYIYEPRHDKTNKMVVRPAKTQILDNTSVLRTNKTE